MKRVLFLTRFYSPHIGGVETHIQKISDELDSREYEVTVLTSQFEDSLPLSEYRKNVHIIRMPFESESSKKQTWSWILGQNQLFQQADIIHIHDVFWWVIPILPFIKSKLFLTFHGWEGTFPIKYTALLQRKAAVAFSQGNIQVGDFIQKWYGTRPTYVTYGAVELNKKKTNAKNILEKIFTAARSGSQVQSAKYKYDALFVGRLAKDNDVQQVIDFFQAWKQKDPHARFLFVGDGEYRKKCEAVGKVVGFVSDPTQYMGEARIVCASSYLSIMTAQLYKKIVVSFYSNPLKKDYLEMYPQSHSMIVSADPSEGLEKLSALFLDKPRYNQMVSDAHDWVIQQTWQKVTDLYEELWSR